MKTIEHNDGRVVERVYDDQNEWLWARCDYITSTEVAALFRCSRWESLRSLWTKKRHRVLSFDDASVPEAEFGKRVEPLIAEDFSRAMNGIALERSTPWRLFTRPGSVLACSVDFVIAEHRRPVELKVAFMEQAKQWDHSVPLPHQLQAMTQIATLETDMAYFAAWLFKGGAPVFRLHPIMREDYIVKQIEKRSAQFWEQVQAGPPPPIDGSAHTAAALRYQYRNAVDEEVSLDSPILVDARRKLADVDEQLAKLGLEKQRLRNLFMEALGEHTSGRTQDGLRVTWKRNRKGVRTLRFDKVPSN